MKIIYIVGQSASGKTSLIREKFLTDGFYGEDLCGIPVTRTLEKTLLLGKYGTGKRCEGTDTLSYSCLPSVRELLVRYRDENLTVVAEGDRVTNLNFAEFIVNLGVEIEAYYFKCSLEDSLQRRTAAGSKPSESFVKSTMTKAHNIYNYLRGEGVKVTVVDTATAENTTQNSLFRV
jgi:hypothetical protein